MITKLIGIGAAGNKAAISAIQAGVIKKEDVLLINSTLKDIPKDYDWKKYCFAGAYGGCGKERNIAKKHIQEDLTNETLDMKEFLAIGQKDKEAEFVVLVSSTEGGTGSGSVPILARYIKEVLGVKAVQCFAFIGFGDDIRGLRNTVEYFKELEDVIAIQATCNAKYLSMADDDKIKAEKLANEDFCRKLAVVMGNMLRDSDHNIDPTDHLKIVSTPNYCVVEYREFDKMKNKDEFSKMVKEMVDDSKAIDVVSKSQRRFAIITNIDPDSTGSIEFNKVLTERYGQCYEIYQHIQHEKSMPNFFAFISSGNKIPTDEIEKLYREYQERMSSMDNTPDEFYAKSFDFDAMDDSFNLEAKPKTKSASDFFSSFGVESKNPAPAEGGSTSKKVTSQF